MYMEAAEGQSSSVYSLNAQAQQQIMNRTIIAPMSMTIVTDNSALNKSKSIATFDPISKKYSRHSHVSPL